MLGKSLTAIWVQKKPAIMKVVVFMDLICQKWKKLISYFIFEAVILKILCQSHNYEKN